MSGSLSVVAFEGELNAIVREYLDFGGFDKTYHSFEKEISSKGKPLASLDDKAPASQKQKAAQTEFMQCFHNGKRNKCFDLWLAHLPKSLRDTDSVAQKLEFYLNIYFAIYPLKFGKGQSVAEKTMADFKKYLETRGATLSQTTEFLPYYALPFVPNPKGHPSYKELFTDSWVKDLEMRLEKFLTLALKSTPQPRLFEIYRGISSDGKDHFQQMQNVHQQLMESERKTMSYIKRHNKVQADYHNLIGITADLVDALEQTVQGKTISPEYLQQVCGRLFNVHIAGHSVDLTRPGTAGDALRQSIAPGHMGSNTVVEEHPLMDYAKVKTDMTLAVDRKKCLLLQALRWTLENGTWTVPSNDIITKCGNEHVTDERTSKRLTQASPVNRDSTIGGYIQNDLLGCASAGEHRDAVLSLLTSSDAVVKQCAARLFNAFASLSAGRTYLAQNQHLFKGLMENLRSEDRDSITREMVLGALQKLSLRRNLQTSMIENGLIEWLVKVLEDNDALSDYTLEYSVALLMNLCLRTSGKKKCVTNANQTLKVLSDLLGHDNQEIRPYVNGALYSILAIPTIREEAKAMGMEEILRCFIKEDQPDMNRQIEFIIKQLNSTDVVDEYESDDEEDEEDEEDQDAMEVDLDKDEIVRAEGDEMPGEKLLAQYNVAGSKLRRRATDMSMHDLLQRPVTPGQRRAAEQGFIPPLSVSRPTSQSASPKIKELTERPPTRSGSRPSTQESQDEKTSSRPTSQKTSRSQKPNAKPEYEQAFGSRPKIPRTPDVSGLKRPSSRGSINTAMPPAPQFSESGPRPTSAGKSGGGSMSPRKQSAGSARADSHLK